MGINALTDVRFLVTQESHASLREYLLNCHRAEWALHKDIAGFRYTAQLRLAASVAAVALRYVDNLPRKVRSRALLESGLPEHAVDAALQDVEPGSDLFSGAQPFMQRPAKTPKGPKDTARALGPQQQPVKKLSPSMPPDEAETYWNLGVGAPSSLPLEKAVLELVTYHHMSMAGNNAYDGDKCQMGAPAMRYVGADYTATEAFIRGESDLATLLRLIPKQWVEGTGLPAWADRTCEQSLVDDGEMQIAHPLWAATWSSNAPACYWEGEELHGVRTGGIPEEWYRKSEMGTTKETRKQWWDTRNQDDPFYLYMPDEQGQLKVQRLDFGRDGTELAVEWAAEGKTGALLQPRLPRILDRAPDEVPVVFVRHYIAGTASSPNIRASEIFGVTCKHKQNIFNNSMLPSGHHLDESQVPQRHRYTSTISRTVEVISNKLFGARFALSTSISCKKSGKTIRALMMNHLRLSCRTTLQNGACTRGWRPLTK